MVNDVGTNQVAQAVHGGVDNVDQSEDTGNQSNNFQRQTESVNNDGDGDDTAAGNAACTGGQDQADQDDAQQGSDAGVSTGALCSEQEGDGPSGNISLVGVKVTPFALAILYAITAAS